MKSTTNILVAAALVSCLPLVVLSKPIEEGAGKMKPAAKNLEKEAETTVEKLAKAVAEAVLEAEAEESLQQKQIVEYERLRRSPNGFFFQVVDYNNPSSYYSQGNEIPPEVIGMFTAPYPPNIDDRRRLYSQQLAEQRDYSDDAFFLYLDVPFFGEFDHLKAVKGLMSRRKRERLTPHLFKSSRPYFPFFSPY